MCEKCECLSQINSVCLVKFLKSISIYVHICFETKQIIEPGLLHLHSVGYYGSKILFMQSAKTELSLLVLHSLILMFSLYMSLDF